MTRPPTTSVPSYDEVPDDTSVVITVPGNESTARPVEARVLPPATELPRTSLCELELEKYQNGTAAPATCPDGSLNVNLWDWYATDAAVVLTLGPDATPATVGEQLCRINTSGSARPAVFELAQAYYGWGFDFEDALPNWCI